MKIITLNKCLKNDLKRNDNRKSDLVNNVTFHKCSYESCLFYGFDRQLNH